MEFEEQKTIQVGKETKLAVPPRRQKIYKSPCSCENFSQQALAWIIHTTGDYFDGKPRRKLKKETK